MGNVDFIETLFYGVLAVVFCLAIPPIMPIVATAYALSATASYTLARTGGVEIGQALAEALLAHRA